MNTASCAINAYLQIMNTVKHRDRLIRSIAPSEVPFLGSWVMYSPSREGYLRKVCRLADGSPTTDAKSRDVVVAEIRRAREKVRNAKRTWFTLCVVTGEATSHTAAYFIFKGSREMKVLNSAVSPLSDYQFNGELDEAAMDAGRCNFLHSPSMDGGNPQDICRGGLIGMAMSYLSSYRALHNDGFCQTWCVLMALNEMEHMDEDYEVDEVYLDTFPTDATGLRRLIREFILSIVMVNPELFQAEFESLLGEASAPAHLDTLLATFRELDGSIRATEGYSAANSMNLNLV
jgi:hypothetical protein